ncbi:MAG: DUF6489 family protein [Rhodothalassiaceae bacterium]
MKVTIDIDCTPQEARAFLGLPDVAPLQKAMMDQMQDRVEKGLQPEDIEQMIKLWASGAGAGFEQMQKLFWSQLAGGGTQER